MMFRKIPYIEIAYFCKEKGCENIDLNGRFSIKNYPGDCYNVYCFNIRRLKEEGMSLKDILKNDMEARINVRGALNGFRIKERSFTDANSFNEWINNLELTIAELEKNRTSYSICNIS